MARPSSIVVAGDGGSFKICCECDTPKNFSAFCVNTVRVDGLSPLCRDCVRDIGQKYYANNTAKVHATNQRWKDENPEKVAKRKAERIEISRAYQANWREKNRDKIREQARINAAKKRKDPKEKIDNAISCGVRDGLTRGGKNRAKWERLVGYTLGELMTHLEKLFQYGMNWDNYGRGGWHVDHIIPRSIFNYETPQDIDFKRCWSLNNLQPLWESENCSKNNKITRPFQPSLLLAANDNDRLDGMMQKPAARASATL